MLEHFRFLRVLPRYPAATTKAQINLEPGVYKVEHPELFKLAKAEPASCQPK